LCHLWSKDSAIQTKIAENEKAIGGGIRHQHQNAVGQGNRLLATDNRISKNRMNVPAADIGGLTLVSLPIPANISVVPSISPTESRFYRAITRCAGAGCISATADNNDKHTCFNCRVIIGLS
jgi:hypothetical protein